MTPKQNRTIYRVINTFGEKNQTMQAIEELMELQKALFENVHRGTDNVENIAEEVADVEIMLHQIKQIYNLDQEKIENIKDYKLERLDHTIDKYIAKNGKTNSKDANVTEVHIDRNTSNGR